jgi:hypothetical protein
VIDFKNRLSCLCKKEWMVFKFYLYVGFEIWRGLLWQTDNKNFLGPANSAKWNGYFTSIIERNTNAIEKELMSMPDIYMKLVQKKYLF